MDNHSQHQKTNALFAAWRGGDRDAYDRLISVLHEDLQQIAHRLFLRERNNHTLQTDDLVSKLYLKMLHSKTIPWRDYGHFLRGAARAMRQILINHARSWQRRGDGVGRVTLGEESGGANDDLEVRLLALEEAIGKMEVLDPAMAQIADLRLSLGLTLQEIATKLELHPSRVKREWLIAKKFLGKTVWGLNP